MRYCLCGELKTVFQLILIDGTGQENEFADDMRGWAAHQKTSGKTVDLLIKEGFDSMEALILIDSDDLAQTKIQRGRQKLLLKALLSLTSSGEATGSAEGRQMLLYYVIVIKIIISLLLRVYFAL